MGGKQVKITGGSTTSNVSNKVKPFTKSSSPTGKNLTEKKNQGSNSKDGQSENPEKVTTAPLEKKKIQGVNSTKGTAFRKRMLRARRFEKHVGHKLEKIYGKQPDSQVHTIQKGTRGGKRIDFVTPSRRPVSVKHSRWHQVKIETIKRYLNEARGYGGRTIRSNKYPAQEGKPVKGKSILILPKKYCSKATRERLVEIKKLAQERNVKVKLM